MKVQSAFPSKFVRAADLPEGEMVRVVISAVKIENVAGQGQEPDNKPVLYFQGTRKGLALNKTNAKTITNALGTDETDDWVGRSILLYATETQFGADTVPCIRVKADKSGKPSPRAANGAATTTGGASRPAARPAMQLADAAQEPEGGYGEEGEDAAIDDSDIPF